MKRSFPGHFLMTPEKIDEMWKTATFVFDTNVILSIYKYSPESSERLIEIFRELKNRIWIPHRVMTEVLENRFGVIGSQVKIYDDTLKSLSDFESKLGKEKLHPAISSDLREAIQSELTKVKKELEVGSKRHNNLYREDSNIKKIFDLFNGKIGEDFDKDTLLSVIQEGEERYADKIPPGYADEKAKASNANDSLYKKTNQYGDYIIWKQILNKFGESKQPVIFITEDRKEDWWVLHPTYTRNVLFARPELVKEFYDECNEGFLLSSLDNFINKLNKNAKGSNNDKLIKETISIQENNNDFRENYLEQLNISNKEIQLSDSFHVPITQHRNLTQTSKEMRQLLNMLRKLENDIELLYEERASVMSEIKNNPSELIFDVFNKISEKINLKKDNIKALSQKIINFNDKEERQQISNISFDHYKDF